MRFDFAPFAMDAARKTPAKHGAGGRFAATGAKRPIAWNEQKNGYFANFYEDGEEMPGQGVRINVLGPSVVAVQDLRGSEIQTNHFTSVEDAKAFAETTPKESSK